MVLVGDNLLLPRLKVQNTWCKALIEGAMYSSPPHNLHLQYTLPSDDQSIGANLKFADIFALLHP